MKYNTIGGNSPAAEGRQPTLTIYADMDISGNKIVYTESEMESVRSELQKVQKTLNVQTKRCRQLVAEYTRKLQEKEQLYQTEKALRDTQLAKVLKALLIFEARLRQEQKYITKRLSEKDYIIKNQSNDIKRLLAGQYCKNCNRYYAPTLLESLDSSSEYVATEQEYQSSTFESLDSSSETYTTLSDRRKPRNDSPVSNEDNTSADYDNLDSLPPESVSDKISVMSENTGNSALNNNSTASESSSECDKTVINARIQEDSKPVEEKLTDTIPVFESGGEGNDNWYASASDQEDDERRDIYRNNPVLECVNQILLQNINDSLNSPPKTPNIERKSKRVKFSDEEEKMSSEENVNDSQHDYYETPIQKAPNFYETPQSIYSNDYEQILSKGSESPKPDVCPTKVSHYYVEMETQPVQTEAQESSKVVRKAKILRTPPALPPKPPNLVSKYKIQSPPKKLSSDKSSSDLEPDYCSISELNLPQKKSVSFRKINVVAEINSPTSIDVMSKMNAPSPVTKPDLLEFGDTPNIVVKKCVDKFNVQLAKQSPLKSEVTINLRSPQKKNEPEIPKLPQVSEIIIPDDTEDESQEERITQDNYVKNNTQILKSKPKKPIMMGSTVSSLISGFNNHQILSEINKKPGKLDKKMFASFENLQNLDKHFAKPSLESLDTHKFEQFDLSQNFEEFKLDDCEIEEYDVEEELKETELEHSSTRVELVRATSNIYTPTLNMNSVEELKKQLELDKSNIKTLETMKERNSYSLEPTYEHFLECTGLSSKSILTPSRMLSNHKSMLKPKDVKLRSRIKSSNIFERYNGNTVKYWSEPFV